MECASFPLVALLVLGCLLGAGAMAADPEDLPHPLSSSLPPELQNLRGNLGVGKYAFSAHLNPFYLQVDLNGDGKPDTAVLVREKATGKVGIAIVHGGSGAVTVVGAGRALGNGGDDFSWMDAWHVLRKEKTIPNDSLLVMKTESASAVIYWTGQRYAWRQRGD